MKKILVMLLLVVGIFTVSACGNTSDSKQKLEAAIADTTIPASVEENFTLPTSKAGGVTITWESNNEAIVISGQNATVVRPASDASDVVVTLTATFKVDEDEMEKTYEVTVLKKEDISSYNVVSVADALNGVLDSEYYVRGVVSGKVFGVHTDSSTNFSELSAQGVYVTDETGTIYVYGYLLAAELEKGDEIIVKGNLDVYYDVCQLTTPTLIEKISTEQEISLNASLSLFTIEIINSITDAKILGGRVVILEDVIVSKSASYGSYSLTDGNDNSINLYSGGYRDKLDSDGNQVGYGEFAYLDSYVTSGEKINMAFVISGKSSSGKWRGIPLKILADNELPTVNNQYKLDFAANYGVVVPTSVSVEGTITLPTVMNAVSITWSSSNKDLISDSGVISTLPELSETVTLTATFVYGQLTPIVKTYNVRVKGTKDISTISSVLTENASGNTYTIEGIVTGVGRRGFYLYDGTGYIYVYAGDSYTYPKKGDIIKVSDVEYSCTYAPQVTVTTDFTTSDKTFTIPEATVKTIAEINAIPTTDYSLLGQTFTVTGKVAVEVISNNNNIVLTDESGNKILLFFTTSLVAPYDTYASQVGETITINVILHQYHTGNSLWTVTDLTEKAA